MNSTVGVSGGWARSGGVLGTVRKADALSRGFVFSSIAILLFASAASAGNKPPVASLKVNFPTATSGSASLILSFDGSASKDPDGKIASYSWDFGDGTSASTTVATTTHAYKTGGDYTASLVVKDNCGATGRACATFHLNCLPIASMNVIVPTPGSGRGPLEVIFDGSNSKDPDGRICSYSWYFGDGASNFTKENCTSHTYAGPGDYTASLIVNDNSKASTRVNVTFHLQGNCAPVPVITATPNGGPAPLVVEWSAIRSYDPDAGDYIAAGDCDWLFDDCDVVKGTASVTRTYDKPGTYTAQLTVHDRWGVCASTTLSITVTAKNEPPVAAVDVILSDPMSGRGPLDVIFDGTASHDPDGKIVSYAWNFGDGTTETTKLAYTLHTYSAGGDYTVTLTVTDDKGATASVSEPFYVQDNQPPVAVITATPDGGVAPITIHFDAEASRDPDGPGGFANIVDALWQFDDGTIASGPAVDKTYAKAGTYSVTLTVYDDWGAKSTATKTVTITAPVCFRIPAIGFLVFNAGGTRTVSTTISLIDSSGKPVPNAVVKVKFTGAVTTDELTSTSGANGQVYFRGTTKKTGKATVTVTGVVAPPGYVFDLANSMMSACVTVR